MDGTPAHAVADTRQAHQPLFHCPCTEWRESLLALAAAEEPDPHLGHAMEFTNPADGGPVMPTIAAHVRHLPAGFETSPRRSTDGTVRVVPSWHALELRADSRLVLFGRSDRAAQEKPRLFREERAAAATA